MSLQFLKEKQWTELKEHRLEFPFKGDFKNGGYSFVCDESGKFLLNQNTKEAYQNYLYCLENKALFPKVLVQETKRTMFAPAIIQCECKETFELVNMHWGACQCPKCGRWYNLFGQELKSPDLWEK